MDRVKVLRRPRTAVEKGENICLVSDGELQGGNVAVFLSQEVALDSSHK